MKRLNLGQVACSLFFLLFSCQKGLYPEATLATETAVLVDAKVAPDAKAENVIAPYRQQVEERMNEVIGIAPMELSSDTVESTLGNFVADLQREQASAAIGQPVDLGLMTQGGLRNSLPKGNIKVGNVFEVMPFENKVLVLTLPGTSVQKLFEFGAQRRVLSVSNATFSIKNKKPVNILIGGKPLDMQRTYTMAVSDYLANGGDNLIMLRDATKVTETGILLREAILKKIKDLTAQQKPVEAKLEGRVKKI
ncbi:5'-nucleotidase C-terminal domain-containing protein [Adhaeribacter aquaticus]|uniref:5'-nucleotidase C-terminal domain-containing protein n=1 Tax=Adhaeribacter aquaticus TaxID=299567 RepID=UPI0008FEE50B|nr:5'-nucleotidase [Adhaeribacter aquaticus]